MMKCRISIDTCVFIKMLQFSNAYSKGKETFENFLNNSTLNKENASAELTD